ncbi:hypothetical protein ACXYMT_01310 [Salinimicrobium sp. CAU 1759]
MKKFYFLLFVFSFAFQPLTAQNSTEKLLEDLKDYHSIPREVAYLHLNKSVLLQGEQLGFSAYVVNKNDLKPSKETTNLYVQVKNEAGEIVREKLLLVENGVASNLVEIDNTFPTGNYTITAFTNWMRNFNEQNFFTESFRVIESNLAHKADKVVEQGVDVQFLPESGHLLSDVVNSIGIIAKDQTGHGIANATVVVRDSKNRDLANVQLNRFGIGKFSMIPDPQENYTAVVVQENNEIPVAFDTPVEQEGVILTATQRGRELRLLVSTNTSSLKNIQKKPLTLTIQNRSLVDAHEIEFREKKTIPVIVDMSTLASGINIITLFDEDRNPIAERLVFNHHELPVMGMPKTQITSLQDSLQLRFPFQKEEKVKFSVSILPQNTVSANRHHNIISYNLLQPYVRGTIENAGWYFEENTEDRKFELDNLLLTQGWSSYDWNKIFNSEFKLNHRFENYFELRATIHSRDVDKRELRYLVHATANNNPLVAEIPSEKEAFVFDGFRPVEGEQVYISRIKRNDNLVPAKLALQSFPQNFPYFQFEGDLLEQQLQYVKNSGNGLMQVFRFGNEIEELGEVSLEAKVDRLKERERKLGAHSFGSAYVVDNDDVALYGTLANLLRAKGVRVYEAGGNFSVATMFSNTSSFNRGNSGITSGSVSATDSGIIEPGKGAPTLGESQSVAVYLDGVLQYDLSRFYQYSLVDVDYVEINKTGMGNGFIGNKGHIKIYTVPGSRYGNRDRDRIQEFDLPLAYSLKKEFYVPRYESTTDDFFQAYGIIDWKAGLTSENGEAVSFKIDRPKVDYQIITEGFTEAGKLIYDVEKVSIGK